MTQYPVKAAVGCMLFIICTYTSASELEEIVVVGQLEETIPLKLAKYGNRIEVVTAQDIKLGGYNDLTQTLQARVPGLYLAPKNGAFDYVNCSLQGSRCQDILWLIDGVRINNRLYNSTSPLDTISAHRVERIEILYGGQGIFYGTQSVAGVVNIVTRSFVDAPDSRFLASFDSNNGFHVSGEHRNSKGPHSYVVYGSLDKAEGFKPFSNDDYQPSGTDRDRGYRVANLGVKYARELTQRSRLSLFYNHTENRVEFAAPARRARSYNDRNEELLTAKFDYSYSDDIDFFIKAYYHDWDSRWTQRDNVLDNNGALTGNTILASDREYWGYEDYGVTGIADIRTTMGFDFSLGYEHQRYSGQDDVLLIAKDTEYINAVFGQIRTSSALFENTQIAFGIRHNAPKGDGNITVWNLSGKHAFSDQLYFRVSAGTSFRSPDAWQLYGNDPCCTQGNPDLGGEESENLNIALGGRFGRQHRFEWELVGFLRRVDNLIGSTNGVRSNSDRVVKFGGAELNLDLQINEEWVVGIDYTHAVAEEKGSNEQIDSVPKEQIKARLQFASDRLPLEISTTAVVVGSVIDTVSGGIGRINHGDYVLIDLSGAWYFGNGRQHRVGIRLENVFNEKYGSSLGRAFADFDASSYAYTNLGTPRTLHASYQFNF